MIIDRNNTDRSRAELVFPHAECKLTFSVHPGEPGMATLRYYKNGCVDCPKISYLRSDDIRRLIKVLEGKSLDENFKFLAGGSKDEKPYILFLYRDARAHFHSCHEGEAEYGHECMSDFERRLLISAAREVLACEKTTNNWRNS